MAPLAFFAILLTIIAAIHLYLWRRLVRDTVRGRWRTAGGLAVLAAGLLVPATLAAGALPQRYERWVAWPGYLWLGIMFYLFVVLLVLEVPVLAARLALRRTRRRAADPEPADPDRRLLLRRAAAITAGGVVLALTGAGLTSAYSPPRIKRVPVRLRRLDPRADGLRVAVIADLHVGPLYGPGQVARVVELVNDLDADLVTVVGDLVSSEVGRVREDAAPLRRMRSRYGSYFVTGNHEYYTGHEEWIEAAGDLGLRVLRNQRVEVTHRGGAIDLAGVNDREGSRYGDPPDYAAALADRDRTRPVVLLAHQPVQVHRAAGYGVDLQLSGHTHGGQVFPFHLLVRLDQPVLSGLAEVDGTQLYVTNGAGFWGPPLRVGAAPDITLIELRAA